MLNTKKMKGNEKTQKKNKESQNGNETRLKNRIEKHKAKKKTN